MRSMALVGVGGALGALLRWGLAELIDTAPDAFPWSTLLVNVVGCLLIGEKGHLNAGLWNSECYVKMKDDPKFLGAGNHEAAKATNDNDYARGLAVDDDAVASRLAGQAAIDEVCLACLLRRVLVV